MLPLSFARHDRARKTMLSAAVFPGRPEALYSGCRHRDDWRRADDAEGMNSRCSEARSRPGRRSGHSCRSRAKGNWLFSGQATLSSTTNLLCRTGAADPVVQPVAVTAGPTRTPCLAAQTSRGARLDPDAVPVLPASLMETEFPKESRDEMIGQLTQLEERLLG